MTQIAPRISPELTTHAAHHRAEVRRAVTSISSWKEPTLEGVVALLHPQIKFYQPHLPPILETVAATRNFNGCSIGCQGFTAKLTGFKVPGG